MNQLIFKVLGSSAAEATPAYFCNCSVCGHARSHGGRDCRLRTAYALENLTRFDFGPDALAQSIHYKLNGNMLEHLFFTHSHQDHFYPDDLESLARRECPLHIYGNQEVISRLKNYYFANKMILRELHPGDRVEIPEQQLTVTALEARHIPTETALLYLLERHNHRILIANDTECFPDSAFAMLRHKYCDIIFIDCTWGDHDRNNGHMGLPGNRRVLTRLKELGAADDRTLMYPIHIGHCHTVPYSDFPVSQAYDGMEVLL